MKKLYYRKRQFLEPMGDNVDSYVVAEVSIEGNAGDSYHNLDANLKLADCMRSVDWGFGIYCSKRQKFVKVQLRKTRKKVAVTRKIINEFLDAVEQACDDIENMPL